MQPIRLSVNLSPRLFVWCRWLIVRACRVFIGRAAVNRPHLQITQVQFRLAHATTDRTYVQSDTAGGSTMTVRHLPITYTIDRHVIILFSYSLLSRMAFVRTNLRVNLYFFFTWQKWFNCTVCDRSDLQTNETCMPSGKCKPCIYSW